MSLLELIIKASSTNTTMSEEELNYPIVLNPDPIMLSLTPESEDPKSECPRPIKKMTGWAISQTDKEIVNLGEKFCKQLRGKFKNTNNHGKDEFLELFTSHLMKIGEKVGISVELDQLEEGYTCKLIDKLERLMGRDVRSLILEACIGFEVWGVLESLTYELMSILKYFLLLPDDGYESLASVRKDWESQALLAIEKASGKGISGKHKSLAKDASLLVMLAHDGFSVTELCLHSLLSSRHLDEVIFSVCIGKLNGEELKALIQYLGKWLRKYERFPQVGPCSKASSALGLKVCDRIPTLENVIKCLGFVVDEHFSSLLLQSEIHEELRSFEGVVNSLASEARLCGTLAILTERL